MTKNRLICAYYISIQLTYGIDALNIKVSTAEIPDENFSELVEDKNSKIQETK